MKSKIKANDFFYLLEMMRNDIELHMNLITYKKIIGTTFGMPDYEKITNPIPNINGVKILFDEDFENNNIRITAKYIPHTTESFEIELL